MQKNCNSGVIQAGGAISKKNQQFFETRWRSTQWWTTWGQDESDGTPQKNNIPNGIGTLPQSYTTKWTHTQFCKPKQPKPKHTSTATPTFTHLSLPVYNYTIYACVYIYGITTNVSIIIYIYIYIYMYIYICIYVSMVKHTWAYASIC